MAFNQDELLTLSAAIEGQTQNQSKANAAFASARNPNEHAALLDTANKVGIPPEAVPQNLPLIKQRETEQVFADFAKSSPKSNGWMSADPHRAALMQDTLALSSKIEGLVEKKPASGEEVSLGEKAAVSLAALSSGLSRTAGGVFGVERAAMELFVNPWTRLVSQVTGAPDVGKQITQAAISRQKSLEGFASEVGAIAAEKLGGGDVASGVVSGLQSLGQMGGAVAFAPLGAAAGVAALAAPVGGEAYSKAREKGLSPAMSLLFGSGQASVEYLTEAGPSGKFFEAARVGAPLMREAVKMLIKDIPGEQVATAWQDLNEAVVLNPDKPLTEYLKERPSAALQTLVATVVAGGGAISVSSAVDKITARAENNANAEIKAEIGQVREKQNAAVAEANFGRMKEILAAATEHPMRTRGESGAAAFKDYVQSVTEGTDVAEVYVNAQVLQDTFAEHGISVAELQAKMPEVAVQLSEGLATKGDVRIPMADLASNITDPAMQEALLPHLKTTPDGMTYNDSQVFYQTQVADMEQRAQQIARETQPVLTREEFTAQQAEGTAPEALVQQATDRMAELSATAAPTPEQTAELAALAQNLGDTEALAKQYGIRLAKPEAKQTYEQYLAQHDNKMAVRAQEISTLRNDIITEMKGMGAFTDPVISAYATPLTEFYITNSANLAITPSELRAMLPVKFAAGEMLGGYSQTAEGTNVVFEVAPDPNNVELTAAWNKLSPDEKLWVSNRVTNAIAPKVLSKLKTKGGTSVQVGGYMGATNTSLTVKLADPAKAVDVARALGVVLSQDSMVVTSDTEQPGTERTGAVHINLPAGYSFPEIEALYDRLWQLEVDGEKVVGGHTTSGGVMGILNFTSLSDAELASAIDKHLGGEYAIDVHEVFVAFPENGKDYDYASNTAPTGHAAPGEQSVQRDYGKLRQEANNLLAQGIADAPNAAEVDAKLYQQLAEEIAGSEVPAVFSAEDKAALRKLWNIYVAAGPEATQYGSSNSKATSLKDGAALHANIAQIVDDVFSVWGAPDAMKPVVKDITRFREGTHAQVPYGSFSFAFNVGNRSAEMYVNPKDKSVELNVLNWGEGGGGAAIYKAVLEFSRNNGLVFHGDSQGISVAGIKRRLENLLSHALQTGDTSYMLLHPKQLAFIEQETGVPLKWTADSKNNVEQMLNASYNLAILDAPELRNVYFDLNTNQFLDASAGGAVADIAGYVAKARGNADKVRREGSLGITTAKRTVYANTILRAKTAESRRLAFDKLASLSLAGLPGTGQLLYQSRRDFARGIAEARAVEDRVNAEVENNLEKLKAEYVTRATDKVGVISIDVDEARELFPDYAESNDHRTRFSDAVHEASSTIAEAVYADALKQNAPEGHLPLVVFTAGGGGSGKSSVRGMSGSTYAQAQIVYDSAMADFESAKKRIDAALEAGKVVQIDFVLRDPVQAWAKGVLPRAQQTGRVVPLYAHAAAHRGAAQTVKRISQHYANNQSVMVKVFENLGGPADVKVGTLDSLANVNYDALEDRLFEALDKEFQNGTISEQVYNAAKSYPRGVQSVEPEARGGSYFQSQEGSQRIIRPTFFSALTQVVEAHSQKKGDPDQWIGILKNLTQKGIKKDELEFTGVLDWLEARKDARDSWHTYEGGVVVSARPATAPKPEGDVRLYQPSKSVAKEEIVNYLRDNNVIINPVVKTQGEGVSEADFDPDFSLWGTDEPDDYYLRARAEERFNDDPEGEREAYADRQGIELEEVDDDDIIEAFYEDELQSYYNDDESPQSRSVSVTLPDGTYIQASQHSSYGENHLWVQKTQEQVDLDRYPDDSDVSSALYEHLVDQGYELQAEDGEGAKWADYTLDGASDYQERLLVNESHKGPEFEYDTHFDEANIAAFTRSNTRYIPIRNLEASHPELAARLKAEGKTQAKVYFLEEVQSDWAQQGRDKVKQTKLVPYKLAELSQDEGNKKAHEARARMTVAEAEGGFVVQLAKDGTQVAPTVFASENEAGAWADHLVNADAWVVNAPGQVFLVLKREHPTLEAAMQYIADTKKRSEVTGEMSKFEISKRMGELEAENHKLMREKTALLAELEKEGIDRYDAQEDPRTAPLMARIKAVNDEYESYSRRDEIAPAPFVTSTDAWTALALKDAIRDAAENDFDLITWTTGQQQMNRWTGAVRKSVDRITWRKSEDGTVHIAGYKGEEQRMSSPAKGEKGLSDILGKPMAEQIINDPNQEGEITGESLNVNNPAFIHSYGDSEGRAPDGKPAIIPKVASQVLKKLGGGTVNTYHLGTGVGAKESSIGDQPGFEVTPKMKEMALQGQPLFQQNVASFDPESLTIAMMKGANLSSMLHESGHFYLEALRTMSAHPNAPQQMKDDFATTLKWFGVPDRATWDRLSLDQKRPYHEQWAQSQERWMLEGKAPTLEMQPVFARFRAWMLEVYKSVEEFLLKNPLAGKLNDEVRGVFARLIASQDAITRAEDARGYTNLFESADAAGVDAKEFADYVRLGEDATQEAIASMQTRSLRDMRWLSNAKSAAVKRLQREAEAKRKAIREEVTKEVMAEPVNLARTFLTKGEVTDPETGDAVKAVAGFKLNTQTVAEMYPPSALARPDLTKLRGLTNKEGLHPDLVAQMFGFRSGDALLRELITGETAKDKIEGLTDQRMLERHGELVDPRAVEQAANLEVHNEARARFLATGLAILTKSPIPASQLVKAAKEAAENAIARKKVRELRPGQYTAAEARANKEAVKMASKDPAKAVEAQRAALLNNKLARAVIDAQDEVEKAITYATKFQNEGTRKNLDLEYLEQIDDLLAPFDLRKGLSLKAIDKRRSLADWVQKQESMGFEPVVDVEMLEATKLKHYKDMTLEELRGLVDNIAQIEHLGRLKKTLLTAKDKREFAARIDEARNSIEQYANRKVTERASPSDVVGTVGKWARTMAASHRKFASIVREMDGGQDNGVMWNLLLRTMNEAGDNETEMKAVAAERMAKLFQPVAKLIGTTGHIYAKRELVPGTKLSMTHEERLMFAMNWGNEGNRQRLMDGGLSGKRALTSEDARAVLDTLTKEEWDFVQGVLDYVGSYRNQIAAQERKLTGKEPKWIEPAAIETKFGTYRGGYFPAKYDAELSTRSDSLEAATNLRMGMKGAFGAAATRNGYTKQRSAEVVGRPILLSFNAVTQHVNEVMHRLAWQEWLVDANRVLKALDGTVRDNYGAEILKEMRDTVKDIAQGDAPATTPVEQAINRIRVGSTIVGMGWRVSTALTQPSGLAQSWFRVGGPWMARGVKEYLKNPNAASELVNAKSKLMRDRGRTMQREINEVLNTVRAGEKVSALTASYFWMIAKTQRTVDIPTWLGAYEKACASLHIEGAPDKATREAIDQHAIALADQAVLDAQSGGQLKDLAKVQRGSPIFKLFTNFYSYFNTTYNLNIEAFRRTNFKNPTEAGLFAVDMLILNTLPVIFSVALKEMLKGGCGNDDLECLAGRVGHEQLSFMMGQMILLREAGSAVDVATGGDGFGYKGPAGLRFFSDLYTFGQQAGQGDADMALFKASASVTGALFHLPTGQVTTTLEGIMAVENGDVEGVAILPALLAGKPRKEE